MIGLLLFSPIVCTAQTVVAKQDVNSQNDELKNSMRILEVLAGVPHGDGKAEMKDVVTIMQARTGRYNQKQINLAYPLVDTNQATCYDDARMVMCRTTPIVTTPTTYMNCNQFNLILFLKNNVGSYLISIS